MRSIGPFPAEPLLVLAGFALACALGAWRARRQPAPATRRMVEVLVDLLAVAVLGARLGFALPLWREFLDAPLDLVAISDGGFVAWVGLLLALPFAWWRTRAMPEWRRPVAQAAGAGVVAWLLLSMAHAMWMARAPADAPGARLSQMAVVPLATLDGAPFAGLAVDDARPRVLNLWASWCPPCLREMPAFARAQTRHPQVRFVYANQGEDADTVRAWLQRSGLELQAVVLDPASALLDASGSAVLPTTVFIGADGSVDVHVGALTGAALEHRLRAMTTGH